MTVARCHRRPIPFAPPCHATAPYPVTVRAVPDLDLARIRHFCEDRVPTHRRADARVEAAVRGRSVTIFDCRPPWRPEDGDWSRVPVAQLRYDPGPCVWTLYRADRNGRWHRYEHHDPGTVDSLLNEIRSDPTAQFWG